MIFSALKKITLFSLALILFCAIVGKTTVLADSNCTQYTLPVTLSPTDPTHYNVVGYLCNADAGNNVQLTLSGATYNHSYWDFPFDPKTYSYVRNTVNTDFATFNLDRIGTGASDHPVPELISIQSNAFVAHQIIQDLRSGVIAGTHFQKVVVVGHSMGSAMAIDEAATYQDVDGVILTGYIHGTFNPSSFAVIGTGSYPAFLDPQFSPTLAPGYLTTKPGVRGPVFYYAPFADPQVIATDESTKDLVTDTTVATFIPTLASHESNAIHVPVLLVLGQFDFLFCGTNPGCTQSQVAANEASFFDPQAQLQINIIPNTGHDLNLHTTAGQWFGIAQTWLKSHFSN